MSVQASSNNHFHRPAEEFVHKELTHGKADHAPHANEGGPHLKEDTGPHKSHEGEHDQGDSTEIPLVYFFYWGILILAMGIILIYFVYRFKHSQTNPMVPLAVFLVLFAMSVYLFEIIVPTFSGRFDPAALRVIHEFHEGANLGFLRFIYKFLLGIFMALFAFLNLDHKKFSSIKTKAD